MAASGGGELGIEIPKGDPEALRSAAEGWAGMAEAIERAAGVLDTAASTVGKADWNGEASTAYSFSSLGVSLTMTSGARSCRDVAGACREFATKLKDAQDDAKRALKQARAAKARLDEAKVQVGAAKKRLAGALSAQRSASSRLSTASAAGPAGMGQAVAAQGELTSAQNAANGADGDIRLWTGRLTDAQGDLNRARKEGKQANVRADQAARTAAGDFGRLAGAAEVPTMVAGGAGPAGAPVVPVTISPAVAARAAGNPFGPNGGFAGDPFAPPGSPGNPFSITPGAVLAGKAVSQQDGGGGGGSPLTPFLQGGGYGIQALGGYADGSKRRSSTLGRTLRGSENPAARSAAGRALPDAGRLAGSPLVRIGGRAAVVGGPVLDVAADRSEGRGWLDSIARATTKFVGGVAGAAGGGAACATETVATLGVGVVACPVLVGGGAIGASELAGRGYDAATGR